MVINNRDLYRFRVVHWEVCSVPTRSSLGLLELETTGRKDVSDRNFFGALAMVILC